MGDTGESVGANGRGLVAEASESEMGDGIESKEKRGDEARETFFGGEGERVTGVSVDPPPAPTHKGTTVAIGGAK